MSKKLPKSKRVTRSKKKPSIFDGLMRTISIGLFFSSLVVVLIAILEIFIYGNFVKNMQSQNIVIAADDADGAEVAVVVLHIAADVSSQVNRKGVEVVALAPEIPVEVIGGYGEYKLGSVLPLLKLDKKDAQTIRSSFAFGLDLGISQAWEDGNLPKELSHTDIQKLGWRLITGRTKTSLSPLSRFHWGVFLSRTSDTDLTLNQAVTPEEWNQAKKWWTLGKLLHVCTVAVVNTTETPGLGAKVSQVLEATGLNVIRVTSDQLAVEDTTIVADAKKEDIGPACNQVIGIVEDFIPHHQPVVIDPEFARQQRADVVIRLGTDNQEL